MARSALTPLLAAAAAVLLLSSSPALAAHPLEDPACMDPERPMDDKLGTVKLRELQAKGLTYDASLFDITEGDAAAFRIPDGPAIRSLDRIVFKAPVHTCRIKLMPGVREWVTTQVPAFDAKIEVAPYSQPPNFNFISKESQLILQVTVRDDATVADINNFLAAHGVQRFVDMLPPELGLGGHVSTDPSSASSAGGSTEGAAAAAAADSTAGSASGGAGGGESIEVVGSGMGSGDELDL